MYTCQFHLTFLSTNDLLGPLNEFESQLASSLLEALLK